MTLETLLEKIIKGVEYPKLLDNFDLRYIGREVIYFNYDGLRYRCSFSGMVEESNGMSLTSNDMTHKLEKDLFGR